MEMDTPIQASINVPLDEDVKTTEMPPDTVAIHTDSGHESSGSVSTPELPTTPQDEFQTIEGSIQQQEEEDKVRTRESTGDCKFFRIKIHVPSGENIDVQISESDIVQELYQMLLERDSTCHRTCFRLYYGGNPLDQFTEIRNIPNIKDNALFRVVEEPYTIREARVHIRHLRDIIRSNDISDAVNGTELASFTCLANITQTGDENRKPRTAEGRAEAECLPPEWLLPGTVEVPLKPLIPLSSSEKNMAESKPNLNCALKQISFSAFNPPPGPRKMKGDVLYLVVDIVEERRFNITCCTAGFYVNASVGDKFRPEKSNAYGGRVHHSIFDLLSELSPHFKKSLAHILKTRAEKHVLERLSIPFQIYQWAVPTVENSLDQIRADDQIQPYRLGLEDHMPGQIRDWNEELQTTHDMPQGTFTEKLCRDRARFKVYTDFLQAAVRGAQAVLDGSVHSINPSDEPKMQMFIWNNIFFSLGFDVKDHYKDIGGDAAAHASYTADLAAVQAYTQIDDPKLHTCGMAIIDLKGYRVMAQSIIPGILDREQHEPIVYGSFDSGKTVLSNETYADLLANSARILKIQPHLVWNGKEEEKEKEEEDAKEEIGGNGTEKEKKGRQYVKLYSSYESKGIVGNDRRHYLMDLLRTFPPDVNFLEGAEPTEKAKACGFPRKFKHKLVCLRHELVDSFADFKTQMDALHAAAAAVALEEKLEEEEKVASKDEGDSGQKANREEGCQTEMAGQTESTDATEQTEEGKEKAKRGEEPADIRLNPDCYSDAVAHHPDEDLPAQRKLVAEAAEFLLINQIPQFVTDCVHLATAPTDGVALTETLHARGINMRYLGKVVEAIQGIQQLSYLTRIARLELLCRTVRHLFRAFVQEVEATCMGSAVAHFLNCLVGSGNIPSNPLHESTADGGNNGGSTATSTANNKKAGGTGKKKRRPGERNGGPPIGGGNSPTPKSMAWTKLTQKALWKQIGQESEAHFGLSIPADCCDTFIDWSGGAQRTAIVRRFCTMNGVQILLRNYQFDGAKAKSQAPFAEEDIFNLVPVVKRLNPRSQAAYNFYLSALIKMQQGYPRIGYDLMQQAQTMMMNIYGPLHPELALCLRFMARMAYAMGDYPDALAQQNRALLISERCNGIDHFETISDYINLAHFSFVNLCIPSSLKLLYRARHLLLLVHGEEHPQMGQIDANIGVILYLLQEYETALKFLNNALSLYQKYGVAIKIALLHHVVARAHSCRGDFRTALSFEKETFNIYSRILGKEHEKTLVSNERLRHLTKQAVTLQKHMNDATQGLKLKTSKQLMPNLQIQPPSLQNIVELLNAFNNLLYWKIQSPPAE